MRLFRHIHQESGAAEIEACAIVLVFCLFLGAMVDICQVVLITAQVDDAAHAAARALTLEADVTNPSTVALEAANDAASGINFETTYTNLSQLMDETYGVKCGVYAEVADGVAPNGGDESDPNARFVSKYYEHHFTNSKGTYTNVWAYVSYRECKAYVKNSITALTPIGQIIYTVMGYGPDDDFAIPIIRSAVEYRDATVEGNKTTWDDGILN